MYAIYLPHPSRCVRERGGGERKRQTDKRVLGAGPGMRKHVSKRDLI